ncbi:hypothetical protein [Serratia fonticola]
MKSFITLDGHGRLTRYHPERPWGEPTADARICLTGHTTPSEVTVCAC